MSERIYNVLFLCTGNTARSILAESILRKDGRRHFRAFSAGSQPKGTVNPFAIKVLGSLDYPTDDLRSKSWEEFARSDAPVMDFVFTVCDNAAGESCPVWPGQPMTAHWGIEDPAEVEGTDLEKEAAFVAAFRYLKNRIAAFTSLPLKASIAYRSGRSCAISAVSRERHPARKRRADARFRFAAPPGGGSAWEPRCWSRPWSAPASWPKASPGMWRWRCSAIRCPPVPSSSCSSPFSARYRGRISIPRFR